MLWLLLLQLLLSVVVVVNFGALLLFLCFHCSVAAVLLHFLYFHCPQITATLIVAIGVCKRNDYCWIVDC